MGGDDNTKPIVAVDCDDCIAMTIEALVEFHNATYATSLKVSDFVSYNYWEVWGGTYEESLQKVRQFFASPFFHQIKPLPGAKEALEELKKHFRLVVVSSREQSVADETRKWVADNYPGIFENVVFGTGFLSSVSESGKFQAKAKSVICTELGAIGLIDDSVTWVEDCLTSGFRAILFDWKGTYKWSQRTSKLEPFIVRAHSWADVLKNKDILTVKFNRFDVESLWWDDRPQLTHTANSLIKELEDRNLLTTDQDALDFGCGTGVVALKLSSKVHSVTGVDTSQGMIDIFQKKIERSNVSNATAICKEIKQSSDLADSYSLVVSSLVFHHIDDIGSLTKVLFGMMRAGGHIAIMDLLRVEQETEQFHEMAKHHSVSHHGLKAEAMSAWFKEAGFIDVAVTVPAFIERKLDNGQLKQFPLFLAIGVKPFPPS